MSAEDRQAWAPVRSWGSVVPGSDGGFCSGEDQIHRLQVLNVKSPKGLRFYVCGKLPKLCLLDAIVIFQGSRSHPQQTVSRDQRAERHVSM